MRKKIKETKEQIINALEGKKVMKIKTRFKSRWEIFLIGWKHTRKFPDYSLIHELKRLVLPRKVEFMVK